MNNKHIIPSAIKGLYKIIGDPKHDNRGGFQMIVVERELEKTIGKKFKFAQWNLSWSYPKVIRGFHPDPWDKIVCPLSSKLFLAIADVDPKSPTFKKVETFNFIEDKNEFFALYISKGLGNSLCNYGDRVAKYTYVVNDYWDGSFGSGSRAVVWDDPDLGVNWPVKDPIMSENDLQNKTLRQHYFKDYPELFK